MAKFQRHLQFYYYKASSRRKQYVKSARVRQKYNSSRIQIGPFMRASYAMTVGPRALRSTRGPRAYAPTEPWTAYIAGTWPTHNARSPGDPRRPSLPFRRAFPIGIESGAHCFSPPATGGAASPMRNRGDYLHPRGRPPRNSLADIRSREGRNRAGGGGISDRPEHQPYRRLLLPLPYMRYIYK